MSNFITAFLPCRAGSERVSKKNIRPFASCEHGLIEIKLSQLISCEAIDKIILSTNDNEIISYAEALKEPKLNIHKRSELLSANGTSTDDLIKHARELVPSGHIFWTHVTSPFVNASICVKIIESYFLSLSKGYDSLMTTTPFRGFLWNEQGPLNYNRNIEKWPRTQTLVPLHEVNSAVFIASSNVYAQDLDRIGKSPYLYQLDRFTGHDIDWEEDFLIAEQLLNVNLVSL
ncbi:cytidylyltransferase domain-containing protein [Synechococcus sp. BMK-MC-1]|uniref:acylneuraminate cytidylyltransferase family protein n=1 Tax=Synechococcus sp. BMK-MC-1 TaxID=1442551 RepID=UPI00164544F4|nr:acylneuraminate cytidylyltransferase family protein [Synechococcus sp. BMK-MC-1]QNI66421.1 N-acylneuraminate cytidylyltransferase [Synechococcus sp. BMK-MC-1]